jgi:hypothetical protein
MRVTLVGMVKVQETNSDIIGVGYYWEWERLQYHRTWPITGMERIQYNRTQPILGTERLRYHRNCPILGTESLRHNRTQPILVMGKIPMFSKSPGIKQGNNPISSDEASNDNGNNSPLPFTFGLATGVKGNGMAQISCNSVGWLNFRLLDATK